MKVFISASTFAEYNQDPLIRLRKNGIIFDFNPYKRKLSEAEIAGFLKKSSYIGLLAGTEPLTKKVLEGSKSLRVISRIGVGLDNLDLKAARQLKIKVFNTPDVLTDSVAELTMGLILSCLRKITLMDRKIRQQVWRKEMGSLLRNKTLGLLGFGRIGRRVAELAKVFGVKVIFHDEIPINSTIGKRVSLNALLKNSDIVSVHASTKECLIGAKEIRKMKKGIILINTSRGSAISESSLLEGLKSGKIAFAGLDVFRQEPYCGALLNLDNVVLTPHIGSYAKEARIKMELAAVDNLLKGLKWKKY